MSEYLSVKILKMLEESEKMYTSLPKKAYEISEEAYKLSMDNDMKSESASSLIMMAKVCRIRTDVNQMYALSYDAYELFCELDDNLGMAKALNLVGITYFYRSMYEQSADTLIKGLKLIEVKDDLKLYSSLLNNIGEVFKETENYDMAIEYYDRGIAVCVDTNLDAYKATMLDNKGDICLIKGEYIEAYKYFNESYDILKKENDPIHLSEAENRLGKAYYYSEDYDTAKLYFERALNRLEEVDNKFYSAEVLINITKLNFKNDQRKSFNSLERAINYAEKANSKKKMSEVYALAAELYEKTNNFKIALEYFKKHHFTEQEIKTSIMGDKLELIKMELARLDVDNTMDEVMAINKQLESEISYQRHELKKIQNVNVNLEKRVFEDSLTEIPNRNYLDYNLVKYMKSCVVNNENLVLFMIDIDHFKKYNDYWGHLKGDECLKSVAKVFKNIRENRSDILGRYGGEEFIYCSKVNNYGEAMLLGNLLRTEVELLKSKYSFENEDNVLTISLGGILVKPSQATDIFDLIEVADKELYKGKDSGRNIVMIKEV